MSDQRRNQIVQLKRPQESNDNSVFAVFLNEQDDFDVSGYPFQKGHVDIFFFDHPESPGMSRIDTELVHLITREEAVQAVDDWAKLEIQEFADKIHKQAKKMLDGDLEARG